jgi:hypothetical protein
MIANPSNQYHLVRFFPILLGLSIFIWLSLENSNENIPVLLALIISSWIAIKNYVRRSKYFSLNFFYILLTGTLIGAAITPIALLLMAIKTGLHAHPMPDFSYAQIDLVIRRTPLWIIGGFTISLGFAIFQHVNQKTRTSSNAP